MFNSEDKTNNHRVNIEYLPERHENIYDSAWAKCVDKNNVNYEAE